MKKIYKLFLKKEREILLIGVAALWAILYFGISALPPVHEAKYLAWDPVWRLPFLDFFIVPYASLFLMPLALLMVPHDKVFFRRLTVTVTIAVLISSAFFILLPLNLPRSAPGAGLFGQCLSIIYTSDVNGNFFPSEHVTLSFLLALGTGRLKQSWRLPMLCWALLITSSTVLIRQHYVVDAIGGAVLALTAWGILLLYERRQNAKSV